MQIDMEEFMRLLSNRYHQPKPLTSHSLKQQIVSKEELQGYSQQLRKIYDHIFNDRNNQIQLAKNLPFKIKKTQVPLCNKMLNLTQSVYKCYDCFIHEAAVMCESCFQNSNHKGHRFKKFSSGGGNCDCGNELALKKPGFCVNHTGTVQRPQIPEQQKKFFIYIFINMIKWFFYLSNNRQAFAEEYGQALIQYLRDLNKESIYYNILTYEFLIAKSNKGTCCLSQIFKVKKGKLPGIVNSLYFQMFALDEFKIALGVEYMNAYNKIIDFQSSAYHSLYIQLLANDNITLSLTQTHKKTFHLQKTPYNETTYLGDLHFISSINEKPAFAFYDLYFETNKVVPLLFMKDIQKFCEEEGTMHEVDTVTRFVNQEYYFYVMMEGLFGVVWGNLGIMGKIVRELYYHLESDVYSYKRNRAVLPYHRAYAMGLFSLLNANPPSAQSLQNLLQLPQQSTETIQKFYKKTTKTVLNCLLDFCQTYCRRNYFDNYYTLYVREAGICIIYDQIFLKQAAFVFGDFGQDFGEILWGRFWEEGGKFMGEMGEIGDGVLGEFLGKWVVLCGALLEIAVTHIFQIMAHDHLKLQNESLQSKKSQIFKQILKKLTQVSIQQLKKIQKCYVGPLPDTFLLQHAEFDRTTKKYQAKVNKEMNEEIQEFPYELYVSKKKNGDDLFMGDKEGKGDKGKGQEKVDILEVLLPSSFVGKFVEFFVGCVDKLEQKKVQPLALSLIQLLKNLQTYSTKTYQAQLTQLTNLLHPQSQTQCPNTITESLRKQQLKKKQSQKKAKLLQKQQKLLQKFSPSLLPEKCDISEDTSLSCLFCRDSSNQKPGLAYFGNLKCKGLRGGAMGIEGNRNGLGFLYQSCFHAAHYQCFKSMKKYQGTVQCPLCKSACNILLPVVCDYQNSTFKKIMQQIQLLLTHQQKTYFPSSPTTTSFTQLPAPIKVFLSMLQCLIQYIGFAGVINQQSLLKKHERICKQILKFMTKQWATFSEEDKEGLYQVVGKYVNQAGKEKKEEKDGGVVCWVKDCVVRAVFWYVKKGNGDNLGDKEEGNLGEICGRYVSKIQKEDLRTILENLRIVMGDWHYTNNPKQQQVQQVQQPQQPKPQPPKLSTLSHPFTPPKTIKSLFFQRDQKTLQNCKNGHNICICLQCQEIACEECKTIGVHNRLHGCQGLYFCFMGGEIVYYGGVGGGGVGMGGMGIGGTGRKVCLGSVYENRVGVAWTSEKQPQQYQLNQQLYNQILDKMSTHTLQPYIRNKYPKAYQPQVQRIQIINGQ